ncbi:MAG: tRNA lysidine(34) synthetase TilS [Bacteroidaceae bacterium]|nr:tRNA lysidine(34) synthetase TilS [Bacteroidaceae bacterium]
MIIEKRVENFIKEHQLLPANAHVLVAISGGADSVALLRMLIKLGFSCHAVHCNFHLRGEESDRDERFVRNLCQGMNIGLDVIHFDTQAYANEHHLSIEMAARELRYREFERIRRDKDLDAIAVAHHQDDAVETLLLNLIRGAGINGLTGMRVRNGHVVRPLLCLTQEEIHHYLTHIGQDYVTDSTNLTDAYSRNKIRLKLLPLMQEINPNAAENIAQAATHLAEAATIYNKAIADNNKRIISVQADGITISIDTLLSTDAPKAQLFEILKPYGFNSAQVNDIFKSLSSESGRMFHASSHTLLRDRKHLILRNNPTGDPVTTHTTLPSEGTIKLPDGTTLKISRIVPTETWEVPRNNNICVLDASRLSQPLIVRHPQEGDRIRPFGMRGSKLLSDLYTDLKLSRMEKQQQWVLCHDNRIVWAIGLRTSELFRLHGNEREVLIIECCKPKIEETT